MSSMTTTNPVREVIGGVDTHGRTHHAAALDAATGKLLGDREFPATSKGYRQLLAWLRTFAMVLKVGVEGTGSYGAGLFGHLDSCGVTVIEVNRPNRQIRRLQGKSDPTDAINAARAVLAETATTVPKPRDGKVEAIRLIRTTRRSAVRARHATINQIHGLLFGAPEQLREQLRGLTRAALVTRCARLRLDPTRSPEDPTLVAKAMLRRLARRIQHLNTEIADADTDTGDLDRSHRPHPAERLRRRHRSGRTTDRPSPSQRNERPTPPTRVPLWSHRRQDRPVTVRPKRREQLVPPRIGHRPPQPASDLRVVADPTLGRERLHRIVMLVRAPPPPQIDRNGIDQRTFAALDPVRIEAPQSGVAVPHGAWLVAVAQIPFAGHRVHSPR